MKYLKLLAGLIVALILCFFIMGFIKPKIVYDCQISVDRQVKETWAIIQDEEKLAEWLPGLEKIEPISGVPGSVGAVSNVHFNNEGQTTIIKETITDIIPGESISMTYESDFMNMDYVMTIKDTNGQTQINTSTMATGNGMISRSIMALFGGSIKKQEETNLANLKATIESNTKNYFQKVEEGALDIEAE